jgi:hypothetical protein
MKTDRIIPTAAILAVLLLAVAPGLTLAATGEETMQKPGHAHQYVIGTVTKIKGGVVTLKTDKGMNRTFSVKEADAELIAEISKGDHVRLELEEGNQIIDIDRVDEKGNLLHPEAHRQVTGTVEAFDRDAKTVALKLDGGEAVSYKLKDPAARKMKVVKKGDTIEVELDEENGIVNDILLK